ncbi:hypothetical protein OIU74_026103, partial [Salix koriyanagi]
MRLFPCSFTTFENCNALSQASKLFHFILPDSSLFRMATVVNSTPLCSSVSLKNSAFIGNSVGGKFLRVKPVLHTC